MRTVLTLIFLTFGYSVFSTACPDFTGTYTRDNLGSKEEIVVVQTECSQIQTDLYWYTGSSKQLIQTKIATIDGQFYAVPQYPEIQQSHQFEGNVLVIEQHETHLLPTRYEWRLDTNMNLLLKNLYYDEKGNLFPNDEVLFTRVP